MAQQVKDPALSLLVTAVGMGSFSPWPGNFHMPRARPEQTNQETKPRQGIAPLPKDPGFFTTFLQWGAARGQGTPKGRDPLCFLFALGAAEGLSGGADLPSSFCLVQADGGRRPFRPHPRQGGPGSIPGAWGPNTLLCLSVSPSASSPSVFLSLLASLQHSQCLPGPGGRGAQRGTRGTVGQGAWVRSQGPQTSRPPPPGTRGCPPAPCVPASSPQALGT